MIAKPILTFAIFAHLVVSLNARETVKPCLKCIKINGIERKLESSILKINALENDLFVELLPQDADSIAFKLDGFETNWHKSMFPTTRYTNLKGRNYTLNIFTEKSGIRSDTLHLSVVVEQTLGEEWWFYPSLVFYGLLIIGAIIYFWTIYNLQQKIKIQSIRNRIARDLHDEVGADLSSVAISIRAIEKRMQNQNPTLVAVLKDMHQTADDIIINMKDTVWMINPKNDDMEQLFEKMRGFAAKVLTLQNVSLIYENTLTRNLKISMEQRYNAYMIFKEAVNNIVKHAQASAVKIIIEPTKEGASLTISDNGRGFDPSVLSDGNGLQNFKRRAEESFFKLSLDSAVGKGTTLNLLIPEL